uniref:Small ribosomal subunit protein uS7c n=1 Tax=Nephroselmis astigmatica TaxID=259378 RepID=A0A088CKE9_9CHLO|nr:ribosomal protein S7 [Nephroselmis astigmatica]AID67734.1 ribosomal protein S7 [Nephroselmis astigmatica]
MSRRSTPPKRPISPDPVYNSLLVQMVISHLLKKGKKALAYRILYDAMKQIEEMTQEDPLKILEEAVCNSTPRLEVKARRVGGSTYQVPLEVKPQRGTALALRWLLASARTRPGRDMVSKLANEIVDASNKIGNAVRKRDETHRMAEANKAFAHYRF